MNMRGRVFGVFPLDSGAVLPHGVVVGAPGVNWCDHVRGVQPQGLTEAVRTGGISNLTIRHVRNSAA